MSKAIQKEAEYNEGADGAKKTKHLTIREYGDEVKAAQQALDGVTKRVTVTINPTDMGNLKTGNYMLCFAKKVGPNYNVVWQSYNDYLYSNIFSWTPQYQMFGTNTFQENVTVEVSTEIQSIELGQTCVLNSQGSLLPAADTQPPDNSLTMNNQYGNIHPGINQLSTIIGQSQISTPIYVAENSIVLGVDVLTPKELVLVWFEQNLVTSTMFSADRSNAVEFDLTAVDSLSSEYSGGAWSIPS